MNIVKPAHHNGLIPKSCKISFCQFTLVVVSISGKSACIALANTLGVVFQQEIFPLKLPLFQAS